MPIETIKCQECGSADVTEFKPGSYICGHCESVFKVVSTAAELCGCGTLAEGRCSDCGSWVCKDHSALWEQARLCSAHLRSRRDAQEAKLEEDRRASEAKLEEDRRDSRIRLETLAEAFIDAMAAAGFPGARAFYIPDPAVAHMLPRGYQKRFQKAYDADQKRAIFGPSRKVKGETVADLEEVRDEYHLDNQPDSSPRYGWIVGEWHEGREGGLFSSVVTSYVVTSLVLLTSGDLKNCWAPSRRRPLLGMPPGLRRALDAPRGSVERAVPYALIERRLLKLLSDHSLQLDPEIFPPRAEL
jgi:hypothetical protein